MVKIAQKACAFSQLLVPVIAIAFLFVRKRAKIFCLFVDVESLEVER
jgi:hypothetical protein